MKLGELVEGLGVCVVGGEGLSTRVCDLTEDSRTALPGSLFVARRGLSVDGRRFIDDAIEAGAGAVLTDDASVVVPPGVAIGVCDDIRQVTAVVAERFYGSPGERLALVGVTGTNGKTTITHLVHQILNRCGVRCGMIGTVSIDDGREVARASMTTPPAIELSRTLATMVESGCRAAVMEVSSHALDQRRTDGVRFDVGVFTNLTPDHGDYHGKPEAYLKAKKRIMELIKPDGLGVVNADDPAWKEFKAPRTVRCSAHEANDDNWSFRMERHGLKGMSIVLTHDDQIIRTDSSLFGVFNAMNILQAFLASREIIARLDDREAAIKLPRAMLGLQGPPGRLTLVSGEDDDIDVFVDFAHTPDALGRVLDAVRTAVGGTRRVCVVFGCGGNRDTDKRALMGAAASEGADRVIVTSDNPRHEPPATIIASILDGMSQRERSRAEVSVDREAAIRLAIVGAAPDDVVVIAGKGHECVQVLPDPVRVGQVYERHFDDREQAVRTLADRRDARRRTTA